jgi:two-component system sensor histidine kinase RpfC
MDINMPIMSGIEAARLYCESVPAALRVPIIALTADATPVTQAACEAAGMVACATKPIQPELLFSLIRQHALDDRVEGQHPLDDNHEPEGEGALRPENRDPETHAFGAALTSASELPTHAAPVVIDHATLARLRQLGGNEFCSDVTKTFLLDGAEILQELRRAVHDKNDEAFRDLVHALRSSAANVGAFMIYENCLQLRDIDRDDLLLLGREHVEQITQNFEKVRNALSELDNAA